MGVKLLGNNGVQGLQLPNIILVYALLVSM